MLRTLSTASFPGSAWAAKTNYHCHPRNFLWHAAVGMGRDGLSAWRLPCHKGQKHRALWGMWEGGTPWRVSLSICRSQVTIPSTIQVYRFYEMYQGIM